MASLKRCTMIIRCHATLRDCRPAGRNRGAELVEFALVLPVLLLVFAAIVDFALLFRSYEIVTNASREGARVGVLSGYSTTDAQTRALQYLDAAGLTDARRTAAAAPATLTLPNNVQVSAIQVSVTYPHDFLFLAPITAMFGGSFGGTSVVGTTTMRTEAQAGS